MPASLRCCGGDRRRRTGERVVAAAGLGERDDLAQRVGAGEQHADPVPAERDAAVRRRAVLERLEQEAELLLRPPRARCPAGRRPAAGRRRGGYGSTRRRSRCRCRRCRTRRPAPRSGAVSKRSIHSAFGEVNGWCTAVQPGLPSSSLDRLEHRGVDDPHERPRRLVDQAAAPADLEPGRAEQRQRAPPLAGGEERAVARRRRRSPRPARRARSSDRFLATGPPSSPSVAER